MAASGHMQSLDEKDVVKLDGLWDMGPGMWTPGAQEERNRLRVKPAGLTVMQFSSLRSASSHLHLDSSPPANSECLV